MKIYKTKQKSLVLQCLKEHENENLTAESIIKLLRESGSAIGEATIYRHLKSLLEIGCIRKIIDKNGAYAYRYFSDGGECLNHFHLVCDTCGRLIHLKCESLSKLYEHIEDEHGFFVDGVKTVFYGKCKNCREK